MAPDQLTSGERAYVEETIAHLRTLSQPETARENVANAAQLLDTRMIWNYLRAYSDKTRDSLEVLGVIEDAAASMDAARARLQRALAQLEGT